MNQQIVDQYNKHARAYNAIVITDNWSDMSYHAFMINAIRSAIQDSSDSLKKYFELHAIKAK